MKTVNFVDSEGKSQDVNVIFSNPERTIAKLKEDRNLTLPIISVSIDDSDEDTDRRRTVNTLDISTVWDEKTQRANRVISKAPKPINLSFSINIWAKYVEDINQLVENILLLFNPSLDFKTSQSTNTKAFIEQITDISTMKTGDREDRILRKMIVITAEAYLSYPRYLVTSTGEIEKYITDVEIDDK